MQVLMLEWKNQQKALQVKSLLNLKKQIKKNLQTFDLYDFTGENYFQIDTFQNYLIFQLILKISTMTTGETNSIIAW